MTKTKEAFRVKIDAQSYEVADPVITGLQLLDAAAKRPSDEYLIFYLSDGQLEEIRLDETMDLGERGIEKFITWRSDLSFRFAIDGRRFEWGAPLITGLKLKQLAGVDPQATLRRLEVRGGEDRPVENIERFFTGKKTTTEG